MKLNTSATYWNIVKGVYQWHNIKPISTSDDLFTHSILRLDFKAVCEVTSEIFLFLESQYPYWFVAGSSRYSKIDTISQIPIILEERRLKNDVGKDGFYLKTNTNDYTIFSWVRKVDKPAFEKIKDLGYYPHFLIFASNNDIISAEEYHNIIFNAIKDQNTDTDMPLLLEKIGAIIAFGIVGQDHIFWRAEFFTTSQSNPVLVEILNKFGMIQVSREEYSEMFHNTFSRKDEYSN